MDKNILYLGAGGALLYFLTKSKAPATTVATQNVVGWDGNPANSSAYPNDPNLHNPNYQLSQSQINTMLANYLDYRQQLPDWVPTLSPNLNAAVQRAWTMYGAIEGRTFYPLPVPSTRPFVPPPPAPKNDSGGGGSWITSALSIAGSVIALLGINDGKFGLNDREIEVLVTGSAVAKDVMPMFETTYNINPAVSKLDYVLNAYV